MKFVDLVSTLKEGQTWLGYCYNMPFISDTFYVTVDAVNTEMDQRVYKVRLYSQPKGKPIACFNTLINGMDNYTFFNSIEEAMAQKAIDAEEEIKHLNHTMCVCQAKIEDIKRMKEREKLS